MKDALSRVATTSDAYMSNETSTRFLYWRLFEDKYILCKEIKPNNSTN